jgi:uncharacterized protein YdeI (BOF family)
MRYRAMALVAASLLLATLCYAETTNINTGKSNTSDRMGGGGGGKGAAGVTTVKSSKSNTSDRMGGGGGGKGAAGVTSNPDQPAKKK